MDNGLADLLAKELAPGLKEIEPGKSLTCTIDPVPDGMTLAQLGISLLKNHGIRVEAYFQGNQFTFTRNQ